jgi:hypothetical protein
MEQQLRKKVATSRRLHKRCRGRSKNHGACASLKVKLPEDEDRGWDYSINGK